MVWHSKRIENWTKKIEKYESFRLKTFNLKDWFCLVRHCRVVIGCKMCHELDLRVTLAEATGDQLHLALSWKVVACSWCPMSKNCCCLHSYTRIPCIRNVCIAIWYSVQCVYLQHGMHRSHNSTLFRGTEMLSFYYWN